MKVRIETGGMLVITPETVTEDYALDQWYQSVENEFNDLAEGAGKDGKKPVDASLIMMSVEEIITCEDYEEKDDE